MPEKPGCTTSQTERTKSGYPGIMTQERQMTDFSIVIRWRGLLRILQHNRSGNILPLLMSGLSRATTQAAVPGVTGSGGN
jgi:hypothetical protein